MLTVNQASVLKAVARGQWTKDCVSLSSLHINAIRDQCGWGDDVKLSDEEIIIATHYNLSKAYLALCQGHTPNAEAELGGFAFRIFAFCQLRGLDLGVAMATTLEDDNYVIVTSSEPSTLVWLHASLSDAMRSTDETAHYLAQALHKLFVFADRAELDVIGVLAGCLSA